ncbi:MAG: ABC transporter substrate-binding protein [Acidobacteriota bacterium]|nr:ABC transporter substrate-binding protein [Acidobacteriota bacterium]
MTACFERAFVGLGGEIAARDEVQVGERDFTALAAEIPSRADVLFYGGAFEGAYLLQALRGAALKQLFAAGDGCWDVENFLQPAKDPATEGEGVLVLSASPPTEKTNATRDIARPYTERYGPVINYALNSYDSTRTLIAAIQHAAEGKHGLPSRGPPNI